MTTTGPGPEEARARAANPRARALEATANPREGALEDDAVDGVARRERRARVIAGTFATVVIPRRATVSRPRASTGLDDGARRRRAIRIRIVGRRVSREKHVLELVRRVSKESKGRSSGGGDMMSHDLSMCPCAMDLALGSNE